MVAWLNRLTSNWNFAILITTLVAVMCVQKVLNGEGQPNLQWTAAILLLLVTLGMIARTTWGRMLGVVSLIAIALVFLYELVEGGFSWSTTLQMSGALYIAYGLWKKPEEGFFDDDNDDESSGTGNDGENGEDDSGPLVSLVHLRSSPRYLESPVLANILSDAWGLEILVGDEEDDEEDERGDGFVIGTNPIFFVVVKRPVAGALIVHNHDSQYFDDPKAVADEMPNLRFAEIVRNHTAWLSVDLLGSGESADHNEGYSMIGKALAALDDDSVLAILCPQHHYFNLWSPDLEKTLHSDAPLDAMLEEVKAPVIGVETTSIEDAIAEARRRWPEFVAAFQGREPDDQRFIVKAPFTGEDDQVEHMWLTVIGLEPEYVHGNLVNDPMYSKTLKNGSQVEVPVAEISDWMCPGPDDTPIGGFTHQAVMQAGQGEG